MRQLPNIETKRGQEELRELGIVPIPEPDDLTRPFWESARRHDLRIQRCRSCHFYVHPPQERCPECGASDFEWASLTGRGFVYSFVIDHRNMVPGFNGPYVAAQINPVEARSDRVRITANIRDCEPSDVYIGMPVQVFFQDLTPEITLPQFRPAADAMLKSRRGDR
jgi:uncharacterized OB-fold protein